MSNITSLNDLYGRSWILKDSIFTTSGTTFRLLESKNSPMATYYFSSMIYKEIEELQRLDSGSLMIVTPTDALMYIAMNGQKENYSAPYMITFEKQTTGRLSVQWCTEEEFIAWWNENTTECTVVEEYETLFRYTAQAIRIKNDTTDIIKPRHFPSQIRAIEGGGGTTPEGTITITENGTYDVTNYASAEVSVEGSGGGTIDVPEVTNIAMDADGLVSWDAVVMEGYTISYLITINSGEAYEVDTNSYDASLELVDGDNTIVVITKASIIVNADEVSATVAYSAPVAEVVKLSTTLVKTDYDVPVVADNDQIYVFINKHAYLFNTQDESLTQVTTSSGSFSGQIAVKYGDDIYFFRGTTTIHKYNITNKAFSTTSLRTSQSYPAVGVVGQYVYLLGGSTSNVIQRVDLEAVTVTTLSSTIATAINGPSGIAVGENVYFTGGYTNSNIYKYNTTDGTTTTIGSLSTKLLNIAMTVVGSNIFIFGGKNEAGNTYYKTIYKIDTKTDTLTTVEQTLPNNLCRAGAAAVGKHSYLFAGETAYNTYTNAIIRASHLK